MLQYYLVGLLCRPWRVIIPRSHSKAGEGISMGRRTFQRNRLIVLASQDGATTKELARRFNLAQKSVAEIIRNERHRLELSLDPVYSLLRRTGWDGKSGLQ
jgi:hypothetical protein